MGTPKLLKEYEQDLQEIVLTCGAGTARGRRGYRYPPSGLDRRFERQLLEKRPLPLGFARNCAFFTGVTTALEAAGIAWSDQVISGNEIAIEVLVAADLYVTAEPLIANPPGREVIDHGGQLPELPQHSIVPYCNANRVNPIAQTLAEYLRRDHN